MPKPNTSARLIAAMLASGALAGGAASVAEAAAGRTTGRPAAMGRVQHGHVTFTRPARITNPWLPLSAHREAVLTGDDHGHDRRIVQRVLTYTEDFRVHGQGVRAAPVERREYGDGRLRAISVSYYVQADDGTVYWLGDDVERFDVEGRRAGGRDRTRLGSRPLVVAMPAAPGDGQRFGDASGTLARPGRVIDSNARLVVTKGSFNRVLVVYSDATAEHPSEVSSYARGVGLIKRQGASGSFELASLR